MSRILDDGHDGRDAHGPCERCGVAFTSAATTCRPRCPNCGHRVHSVARRRAPTPGERSPPEPDVLNVELRQPWISPFDPDGCTKQTRWRLN